MEYEMKAERIFRAVAIAWHREKDLEGHQPKLRLLHLAESLGLNRRELLRSHLPYPPAPRRGL